MKFGEPGEIRTPGPLIKSQLRYQLRHRLRYIRRLFCRQQALSPSRRVDFCFMLHQTRNPNVDWAKLTPNWIRTNISMQLSFYH